MAIATTTTQKQRVEPVSFPNQRIGGTNQQDMEHTRELAGSHILCEALVREGVELLYGYPGGAIMPFYDALTSYPTLRHILVRHEQAAAHAADGYARATGKVGVCVATSGPGATNLVTGLATAYMDSTPIVAITGQVARPFIGRDAFQETDVIGVTQPITKHNFLVRNIEDLADTVHEAFRLALSGRPGPVLIDVPKDIQLNKTLYRPAASVNSVEYFRTMRTPELSPTAIAQAAKLITEAQRPLIMSGHGVILSKAYAELLAFAEKADIPVITTLLGLSALPETHPLALGMPGMHGPAHVNQAIGIADLIIGVGLRFDDRVTGKVSEFAPHAQIVHIDIDPSEIHKVKVAAFWTNSASPGRPHAPSAMLQTAPCAPYFLGCGCAAAWRPAATNDRTSSTYRNTSLARTRSPATSCSSIPVCNRSGKPRPGVPSAPTTQN